MESNVAQLAIHEQLWTWFESHKKQVLWTAVVVVAAAVGTGYFIWHQNAREVEASETLSKIGAGAVDRPGMADEILKVAADYPNTDAGARALLLGGGMLFSQGKYAEARVQFEKYLRTFRETPLASQALLGVATCLDMQGNTNEAIAAYRDVIEHHPGDNIVPLAKFSLAQLYEGQNKLEQARDLYMTLARPGPFDTVATESNLRLKDLIQTHPELTPPRPAFPTNMPSIKLHNP
jgi:tetratricopeptide (TPR) repeat protein